MTAGRPHPAVDALLDAYIAAWHAGDAPSSAVFVEQADPAERDELAMLITAFLQIAPTVEPTKERAAALASDPLVARLTALEDAHWTARPAAAAAPWGETLRTLRERAGLSIAALAEGFASRFGLVGDDAARAPHALASLESGDLRPAGVAARAARALEELLSAPKGVLVAGVAPAFGGPLLRGALPESPDERTRFTELLREVDDALPPVDGTSAETLHDLLGA